MIQSCEVHFRVKFYTQFSEHIKVVGNIPQLGSWDPIKGLTLTTNQDLYPFWISQTPLSLNKGTKIEFKFAVFCGDNLRRWENTPFNANRLYRALCYKAVLECCENILLVTEKVVQRYMSNEIDPHSKSDLLRFSHLIAIDCTGVVRARKRLNEHSDEFNPFLAAQDLSVSDESYSSPHGSEIKLKLESPTVTTKRKEQKEIKPEKHLFNGSVSPELHSIKDMILSLEKHKKRRSELSENHAHLTKPIFLEDNKLTNEKNEKMQKEEKTEKNEEPAVSKHDQQKNLSKSRSIPSLIEQIQNSDDVFSKIYEKLTTEKVIEKKSIPSLIESFNEHTYFNARFMNNTEGNENIKLLVTMHRLPFKIKFHPGEATKEKRWEVNVHYEYYASITQFFGHKKLRDVTLVGGIDIEVAEEHQAELEEFLRTNYQALPIFTPPENQQKQAEQYCNELLFNAFYNLLDQTNAVDQEKRIPYYRNLNQFYAEKILSHRKADENAAILIHDYHLLLVPQFIALFDPKQVIGFIFETAFPTIEAFMLLDNHLELLKSILCCDMIFFRAGEHLRTFLTVCSKVLRLTIDSEQGGYLFINYFGRRVYLYVVNHAIESQVVSKAINQKEFFEAQEIFTKMDLNQIYMVCATHFHPFEGLVPFLEAMMEFFTANPQKRYKLMLLQLRSRTLNEESIPSVGEHKSIIIEMIKKFNKELNLKQLESSIEILENCSQQESYAALSLAEVFISFTTTLSADIRALEYVMVKQSAPAAIVRSKSVLGQKNINIVHTVNPNRKNQVIELLTSILSTPKEDQERTLDMDKKLLQDRSVWKRHEMICEDISKLIPIKASMNLMSFKEGDLVNIIACRNQYQPLDFKQVSELFAKAKNSVIIINYENVLVNTHSYDRDVQPNSWRIILQEQIELLDKFTNAAKEHFYIISSKSPEELNCLYEHFDAISVLAENGFYYKVRKESPWQQLYISDWSFKPIVQKIMQNYVFQTEGSWIENKEGSVCWNYENVRTSVGDMQVEEMKNHLQEVLQFLDNVEIFCGNSWIEVKPIGINKGIALELVLTRANLQKPPIDFVLCIGADSADEGMLLKLNEISTLAKSCLLSENASIFTASVGKRPSHAKYYLDSISDVYDLFNSLVNTN